MLSWRATTAGLAFLTLLGSAGAVSHAEPSEDENKPAPTCTIAGATITQADTPLFDAPSGGHAIAQLTGTHLGFTLSQFPADLTGGRVKISTSRGDKKVNITGFSAIHRFRFIAKRDLAVDGAKGVWITKGQQLRLVSASGTGFVVDKHVMGSADQKVQATVGCGDVTVELQTAEPVEVPDRARTYQMKNTTLALFDAPAGDEVFKLRMEDNARKVFWSTETKNGFVHIASRADIAIDAWARASDLSATRHAELFDVAVVSPKPLAERTLEIDDAPPLLTATSELPIHRRPTDAARPIGRVEEGAQFYAMERSGDWTNILPDKLVVLPPEDGGFWVRTAGLPSK